MANPHPSNSMKPGETRNPHGRPKRDWTVQGLIEDAMEEQDETGVPAKKIVYNKLVALAKKGDIQAIRELNNRLDGMPHQKVDLSGQLDVKPILGGLSVHSNPGNQTDSQTK